MPFTARGEVQTDGDGFQELHATLRFRDSGGTADYYRVYVFERLTHEDGDDTRQPFLRSSEFESRDPVVLDGAYDRVILESGDAPRFSAAAFSDEAFDGKSYTLSLSVPSYSYDSGENVEGYYVMLAAISADFYRYLKSRQPLENSYDENPFEEPVELYSNVEGGLGIFAGSSATRQRIGEDEEEERAMGRGW